MHEMHAYLFKEIENKYNKDKILENYRKILISILPVVPHFANECLDNLGLNKELNWPSYDNKIIEEKNSLIVIQINGKKRSILNVKKDTQEKDVLELIKRDQISKKYLNKKDIKKVIFVKNRLMNILIND